MLNLQEIELEIANLKADLKKTKTQQKKEALSKQIAKLDYNLKVVEAYEAINIKDVVINGDPTKLGVVTAKEIQNQLPVVWVDWDGLTTSSVPNVLKIVPSEQLKWQWIENNYTRLYDRISCNDMAVLLEELDRLKTEEKVLSSSSAINITSSPIPARTSQASQRGSQGAGETPAHAPLGTPDDVSLRTAQADDKSDSAVVADPSGRATQARTSDVSSLEQNKAHQEKIIELWEDAIAFHYPLDEGFFLHNRKVVVKSYQLCKQHNLVFPVVFDGKHQHLAHPLELRRIPLGLLTKVAHGGNHGAYEPARQPRRTAPPQDRTFAQLNIFPEDNTDPNEPEEPKILEDNTDSNESEEEQVVGSEARGWGDFNKPPSTVGSKISNQKSPPYPPPSRFPRHGNAPRPKGREQVVGNEKRSRSASPRARPSNDDYSINKENTSNLLPTTSLTIDPEFQNLLRPLTEEEYEQLEKNLIKDRYPVITVWKNHNTIIDGHHSYEIAQKHNIPYTVREIELESRSAVIQWMYDLQLGRRNLSEDEKSYYRGKQFEFLKEERKKIETAQVEGGHRVLPAKKPLKSSEIIAKKNGVTDRTIRRDSQYVQAVDAIAQKIDCSPQEIISSSLSRKQVKEMVDLPVESIKQKLENPTFIEPRELPELKVGDVVRIKSDRKNKDFVGYNGTYAICDQVYESCADIRIWQQLSPHVHKQFLVLVEEDTVTLKVTVSKNRLKTLMKAFNNIEEAIM